MKIFIGSDHRGFALKEKLKSYLEKSGHAVFDVGAKKFNPDDDYPRFGRMVGEAVKKHKGSAGIALCGSGAGVSVAANRIRGVRAVLSHDLAMARASKRDDDTNVLCLGSDFITEAAARRIISGWLKEKFTGRARHQRRIRLLDSAV